MSIAGGGAGGFAGVGQRLRVVVQDESGQAKAVDRQGRGSGGGVFCSELAALIQDFGDGEGDDHQRHSRREGQEEGEFGAAVEGLAPARVVPGLQAAVDAVILTIQSGIPVARIGLLDEVQIRGINLHSKLGRAEAPTLFFEFHGTDASVAEQAQMVGEIAHDHGAAGFTWATLPEERSRLWLAPSELLISCDRVRISFP